MDLNERIEKYLKNNKIEEGEVKLHDLSVSQFIEIGSSLTKSKSPKRQSGGTELVFELSNGVNIILNKNGKWKLIKGD